MRSPIVDFPDITPLLERIGDGSGFGIYDLMGLGFS
jgi:hypothetical protein